MNLLLSLLISITVFSANGKPDTSINRKSTVVSRTTLNRKVVEKSGVSKIESAKEFDTNNFWSAVVGAVVGGLIGLSPSIFGLLKNSKISGKVLSQYSNFNNDPISQVPITIFVQKIAIFVSNDNFYLKDFQVYIKYANHAEVLCKNWIWRDLTFFMIDNTGVGANKRLNIDKKEYLLHHILFPKDQSIAAYISFTTDTVIPGDYEYLKYVFIDFKGKQKELIIHLSEISPNTQLYDNDIWI